jgi:hypothetical protein
VKLPLTFEQFQNKEQLWTGVKKGEWRFKHQYNVIYVMFILACSSFLSFVENS